jgi:hypothetical protein
MAHLFLFPDVAPLSAATEPVPAAAGPPDLFAASTTQIAIRLRSLRDTGITWRLWRGDKPLVVQRNARHKRFSTTEKYVGDIEKLSAECGAPSLPYRPLSSSPTPPRKHPPVRMLLTEGANGGS